MKSDSRVTNEYSAGEQQGSGLFASVPVISGLVALAVLAPLGCRIARRDEQFCDTLTDVVHAVLPEVVVAQVDALNETAGRHRANPNPQMLIVLCDRNSQPAAVGVRVKLR